MATKITTQLERTRSSSSSSGSSSSSSSSGSKEFVEYIWYWFAVVTHLKELGFPRVANTNTHSHKVVRFRAYKTVLTVLDA